MPVEKFLGGVSRFQKDVYPQHQDLFEKLALGQRPDALFITCADSRIDPCLLTQTKPGELFICRVIGNIVPPYPDAIGGVSATIEYAVGVLRVPEVIVCGHTDCGVMKGALNPEALGEFPNVTAWLRYANVEHREPAPTPEFLLALTESNVIAQIKNLHTHPAVAARLEQGDLASGGDDDVVGRNLNAASAIEIGGNLLAKRWNSDDVAVSIFAIAQRLSRGVNDRLSRMKVGLTQLEVNNRAALRLKLFGAREDGQRAFAAHD